MKSTHKQILFWFCFLFSNIMLFTFIFASNWAISLAVLALPGVVWCNIFHPIEVYVNMRILIGRAKVTQNIIAVYVLSAHTDSHNSRHWYMVELSGPVAGIALLTINWKDDRAVPTIHMNITINRLRAFVHLAQLRGFIIAKYLE